MGAPSKDFRDYYTGKEGYPPREGVEPRRKRTPVEWVAYIASLAAIPLLVHATDDGDRLMLGIAIGLYVLCMLIQVLVPWREKRRAGA